MRSLREEGGRGSQPEGQPSSKPISRRKIGWGAAAVWAAVTAGQQKLRSNFSGLLQSSFRLGPLDLSPSSDSEACVCVYAHISMNISFLTCLLFFLIYKSIYIYIKKIYMYLSLSLCLRIYIYIYIYIYICSPRPFPGPICLLRLDNMYQRWYEKIYGRIYLRGIRKDILTCVLKDVQRV